MATLLPALSSPWLFHFRLASWKSLFPNIYTHDRTIENENIIKVDVYGLVHTAHYERSELN